MPLDAWLLFVALSILPAFSPGPGLLLTMSNSLRFGSRITLWSAFGNTIGIAILGMAVTFGLGAIMLASSLAFMALKIIGGLYLVWLGIKTWRDRSNLVETQNSDGLPKSGKLFFTGVGIALTNPKAMAVLVAIIPPFLTTHANLIVQGSLLSITYAMVCLISHIVVALLSGRFRLFITSPKRMKILRRSIGATFMGFGIAMAAATR
ncbi:MAG: LysE family transporter [Cohaesibacter sp.]|nr:LysE family transporter [Cohaesibacter sp.]MCV6602528.1 LysE family transporter [Cohaesibacter sp.]